MITWWDIEMIIEIALSIMLGLLCYDVVKAVAKRWRGCS